MGLKSKGFTLVELMVVIAIVGLLASVALPSYNTYVLKSRRAKAIIWANDYAAKQEVFYNRYNRYAWPHDLDKAGLDVKIKDAQPVEALDNLYILKLFRDDRGSTHGIRLTPTGSQKADAAECPVIWVDQKTARNKSTNDLEKYCR